MQQFRILPAFLLALLVASCTPPAPPMAVATPGAAAAPASPAPAAAAALRLVRLQEVATSLAPSEVTADQLYAPAGSVPGSSVPLPVARLVFPDRVLFDFDRAVPRPEAGPILDRLARVLRDDGPDTRVMIVGFTDAVGSDAYNLALSHRRAESVAQALIARGVSPEHLSTMALGKSEPVASNATSAGRALNRRVEFLISDSETANLAVLREQEAPLAPPPAPPLPPGVPAPAPEPRALPLAAAVVVPPAPAPATPAAGPLAETPAPPPVVVPLSPRPVLPAPLHSPTGPPL